MTGIRTTGVTLALSLLALAAPAAAQPPRIPVPQTLQPDDSDEAQSAASVVQLNILHHQGNASVWMFGTGGGDPAMNGLYTYLAFYVSPAEPYRIFKIGDFLTYRLVSETPGRALLEVRESVMNEATGEIGARTRRIALTWTPPAAETAPASVATRPAN